ncbi:hypothetical protein HNV11_00760 [Spirosoma taeanense]|uniref:Oligosaccharide flippase family protein n=1 Tax=Spirosoma taeanense TaxID=2735870 RepID=A0A6M5Y2P9_9BACT|nr:hypothetical protein [Spirosoma taeanense]QJW88005.1 hypothetical protein HNV11_00760 [Spirosoma taeanense]
MMFAKAQKLVLSDLLAKYMGSFKSTFVYMLVPVVSFSLSIYTSPIFARHLSSEEFAYMGFYASVGSLINCFYGLLFQTYYMSIYFRQEPKELKATLASLTLFSLGWNFLFFPLSLVLLNQAMSLIGGSIPFFPYAILALATQVFAVYTGLLQATYRLGKKPIMYFVLAAGYRVLTMALSIYFVTSADMGLTGRLLGTLVTEVVFFVVAIRSIMDGQAFVIQKDIIKHAIRTVLPLLPASFLYLPVLNFDNLVLERLNNPTEMGFYNIGKNIANYLYMALFPFYQTMEPDIYKYAITQNYKVLGRISLMLVLMVVVCVIGFWLVSPYIINYLTAGRYNNAVKYANIHAVTSGLMILFSISSSVLNALQQSRQLLISNMVACAVCVASYIAGGIYFDQLGVAYATAMTFMILIILQASFSFKKLSMV